MVDNTPLPPAPATADVQDDALNAQRAYEAGYESATRQAISILDRDGDQFVRNARRQKSTFDQAIYDFWSTSTFRRLVSTNSQFGYGWMDRVADASFTTDAQGHYQNNHLIHRSIRAFAGGLDRLHDGLFGSTEIGRKLYEKLYDAPFEKEARNYNRSKRGFNSKSNGITYGHRNALVSLSFMWMGFLDNVTNHFYENGQAIRHFFTDMREGEWKKPGKWLPRINPLKLLWREAKWLGWDLVRNVIADAEVGLGYVYIKEKGLDKKNETETVTIRTNDRETGQQREECIQVNTTAGARHFYTWPFIWYNVYVYGVHNSWADLLGDTLGITKNKSDVLAYMQRHGVKGDDLNFLQKTLNAGVDIAGYSGQRMIEIMTTMIGPAELFSPLRFLGLQESTKQQETRQIMKAEIDYLDISRQVRTALPVRLQHEVESLRILHSSNDKPHFLTRKELGKENFTTIETFLHHFYVTRDRLCSDLDDKQEYRPRPEHATAFVIARENLRKAMLDHAIQVAGYIGLDSTQFKQLRLYLNELEDYFKEPNITTARMVKPKAEPTPIGLDKNNPAVQYAASILRLYHVETSRHLYEQREYHGKELMAQHWVKAHFDAFERVAPFERKPDPRLKDYGIDSGMHVAGMTLNPHGPSKRHNFERLTEAMKRQAAEGRLPADWKDLYSKAATDLRQTQEYAANQSAYGVYIAAKRAMNTIARGTPGLDGQWFGDALSILKAGEKVEPPSPERDIIGFEKHLQQSMTHENATLGAQRYLAERTGKTGPVKTPDWSGLTHGDTALTGIANQPGLPKGIAP